MSMPREEPASVKQSSAPQEEHVADFLCPGLRLLGLHVLESTLKDILNFSGAQHVVSVGCGLGFAEADISTRLPSGICVWGIDPSPGSFNSPSLSGLRTLETAYSTVAELCADESCWPRIRDEGLVLLIIWPSPEASEEAGFDIDAVRRLRPCAVITICDTCGPQGIAGSESFCSWLWSLKDMHGHVLQQIGAADPPRSDSAAWQLPEDTYVLTHVYRRPGYLKAPPKECLQWARTDGGLRDLSLQVEQGARLGVSWDGATPVLKEVCSEDVLAKAGGGDLSGWRLIAINNCLARGPQHIEDAFKDEATVRSIFIRDPWVVKVFTCAAALRADVLAERPPLQPQYVQADGFMDACSHLYL